MDKIPVPDGALEKPTWEVQLSLKRFLTITELPPEWRGMDLYILREGAAVFYVGQSECAFTRVWRHIQAGPHGHSIVGRFILVNWPRAAAWMVELLRSDAPRFREVGCSRSAAERVLIETLAPCLNISLNWEPAPLPEGCLPANAPLRPFHSYKRMLHEAAYAPRSKPEDLEWE